MGTNPVGVAIIGGGASGTLVATHLVRGTSSPSRIALIERGRRVGEGIAYSTASECHLLNVPARSMSAFEDDPEHFVRWLANQGRPDAAGGFVPRRLYGRYLRDTLWSPGRHGSPSPAVETLYGEVVDIEPSEQGAQLVLDNGHTIAARTVVLATGTAMRPFPAALAVSARHPRCVVDPWAPGALASIDASATVTLLGSGLTAVDVLLALGESGHHGPVHAISRHGLLPRAHRAQSQGAERQALSDEQLPAERLFALCGDLDGSHVRLLLHRARQILEGCGPEGADWRDMADALRPVVPRLWAGLSAEEQLRFRRHLERLWNVHRHRMAPQIAQTVEEMRDSGRFFVHAGAVGAIEHVGGSLRLQVRLPVRARPYAWGTDWLINCTGTDPHPVRRRGPLMDALGGRGLVRPGPIEMGLATDHRGRALDVRGRPSDWLWAIGPLRQGHLLESAAVPEIRVQARDLAVDIHRSLAGRDTNLASASADVTPGPKNRPPSAQLLAS